MMDLDSFMKGLIRRNPGQSDFHQAVKEVAEKVIPFINANPKYEKARILERMVEPDRIIIFRVVWEDDERNVRVNKGYRVQFNNTIGPYKGGLRFDRDVKLSTLKFLGFEQIFKNSLTTLPIGGGKGGANFSPKKWSDSEVMRFCQAYMTELYKHIGKDIDVPAGDIGVGAREIGYLFGQHKRLTTKFTSVLTGKRLEFGGSPIRAEATGYGAVYFAREMLKTKGEDLEGKTAVVSGSGNVAQYAAQRLIRFGAKVVTMSDRSGFIYDENGLTEEKLDYIIDLKTRRREGLENYANDFDAKFYPSEKPWRIPCQMAFPCATQNEMNGQEAQMLLNNGCELISEGANMPINLEGIKILEQGKVLYAPGKAANAGGVAISGIEMTQNAMRMTWTREEVDRHLQDIMQKIHTQCVEYGKEEDGHVNYIKGANIAGFVKVANAMLAYGVM